MKKKYSIGIDFGTLSARGVLVDTGSGEEIFESSLEYPHAVMSETLPDGTVLPPDFALQDPADYLQAVTAILTDIRENSGCDPSNFCGIGIDFTSCTVLPTAADGTPLCFLPEFANNPHAYVKLWKHHSAKKYADLLNEAVEQNQWSWLSHCSNRVSPEWMLPKLMQILAEAPEVLASTACFPEAGDWLVWQLTGNLVYNSAAAGFVGTYHDENGYPPEEDLEAVMKGLGKAAYQKAFREVTPPGTCVGGLTEHFAALTGLPAGLPVAASHMDSQAGMLALTGYSAGTALGIMGTSTVYLVLADKGVITPGISSYVKDGIVPGFYGYSAGQSCVGDHFAWSSEVCFPESYEKEAAERGISKFRLLSEKAAKQKPGENGLLALDWYNGNRSVLLDMDLTGCILGLTLQTKPEDIYRALIEATAFGARVILERFGEGGIPVDTVFATGGIARKDPFAMQVYADILKRPIGVTDCKNGPALGSAVMGAVAGGVYPTIPEASAHMGCACSSVYRPIAENASVYDLLYREFRTLHDYFGTGENEVMHRLKALKNQIREQKREEA